MSYQSLLNLNNIYADNITTNTLNVTNLAIPSLHANSAVVTDSAEDLISAQGTVGQVLTAQSSGPPQFQDVSEIISVAPDSVVIGDNAGLISSVPLTANQVIVGNTGSPPSASDSPIINNLTVNNNVTLPNQPAYEILCLNANNIVSSLPNNTAGFVLSSNGPVNRPTFQNIGGIINVQPNSVVIGDSSGHVSSLPMVINQTIQGHNAGPPTVTDSPTFTSLLLTGNLTVNQTTQLSSTIKIPFLSNDSVLVLKPDRTVDSVRLNTNEIIVGVTGSEPVASSNPIVNSLTANNYLQTYNLVATNAVKSPTFEFSTGLNPAILFVNNVGVFSQLPNTSTHPRPFVIMPNGNNLPELSNYSMPLNDGTSGQILTTNGNQFVSFQNPTSTFTNFNVTDTLTVGNFIDYTQAPANGAIVTNNTSQLIAVTGSAGKVLTSNGPGTNPTFQSVSSGGMAYAFYQCSSQVVNPSSDLSLPLTVVYDTIGITETFGTDLQMPVGVYHINIAGSLVNTTNSSPYNTIQTVIQMFMGVSNPQLIYVSDTTTGAMNHIHIHIDYAPSVFNPYDFNSFENAPISISLPFTETAIIKQTGTDKLYFQITNANTSQQVTIGNVNLTILKIG